MKKGYGLILVTLFLLSSCGQEEIFVQPIPEVPQQYDYIHTSVPVIDAIIDTKAEVQYIQKIHNEYEKLANYYNSYASKSSVLTTQSNPQTIANTQERILSLLADLDYFKNRMNTIDLPSTYRTTLIASLNAFIQSLTDENERLSASATSETEPSSALYQTAQEANKKVQQVYRELITS